MGDQIYYHLSAGGTGLTTSFFNTNEGASGELITNIPTTNQLSKPFEVHKLKVRFAQDLIQADCLEISESSILKFKIGKEEILKLPVIDCLSGSRIEASMTETAGDLWQMIGPQDGYVFKQPVTIPASTFFEVVIVHTSGLSTGTGITCTLEGVER